MMDDHQFRTAMSKFATGVTVIAAEYDGEIHGMTANAFMSVSLDPKLILISIGHHAKMRKMIESSGTFSVNVLSREQKDTSMLFAGQKQATQPYSFNTFANLPIVQESLVSLACTVHNTHREGDHTLFVGNVYNLLINDHAEPLTFYNGHYKNLQFEGV